MNNMRLLTDFAHHHVHTEWAPMHLLRCDVHHVGGDYSLPHRDTRDEKFAGCALHEKTHVDVHDAWHQAFLPGLFHSSIFCDALPLR